MRLTWRDVEVEPGLPPIFTSLTAAEAAELALLAKGRRVLEIGSAFGYSTVIMGLAGAEDVWSVDPHTGHDSLAAFCANVERFGLKGRVKVCVGTSQGAAELRENGGGPAVPHRYFGLVFVDGGHELADVRHDRDWAMELVVPFGGVIAFHDYDEETCPGIKPALDEWPLKMSHLVDTLAVYSDPRLMLQG